MKKKLPTIIFILAFMTGLSLLLYPTVSDYWNSFHQSRAILDYAAQVADMDNKNYEQMWRDAEVYNADLPNRSNRFLPTEEEHEQYMRLLNISGQGIMGYLEIPAIRCTLPVYHGTDEAVLQIAVGHIEGSSLPVGGLGTHCVLSGHRGLPSAKLLSNLDKVREGDVFVIRTLDEYLTYEVDQIRIVDPRELSDLEIVQGKDYCTLVTCTPYGINTHRLLVRGYRIEDMEEAEAIRVTADAMQIEPLLVAPIVAIPILLLLLIYMLLPKPKNKYRGDANEK